MDIENLEMDARNLRSSDDNILLQAKGIMNQSGKLVADLSLNQMITIHSDLLNRIISRDNIQFEKFNFILFK